MQKLPLGLSTFRNLRESNCLYVDKTEYAYNLITKGWRYFLARPRRFGKSLFVSTLKEILSGNKTLFEGLWIGKSDYAWHEHGVIVLSLSTLETSTLEDLNISLCAMLDLIAKEYSLEIERSTKPKLMLLNLVMALHKKFGRVAILIDEYDYPLLRTLDKPDYAIEIRNALRDFFIIIKDLDAYINFVFFTGVSSFSKAGVFSGLNNLRMITLNDEFGAMLGYTGEEVDFYFKDYIQAWSDKKNISYQQLRQEIKVWYNGYRFGDNVSSVYNPFSLMNALYEHTLDNFWIQSGTPSFLIKEIIQEYRNEQLRIFDPENLVLDKDSLSAIDIGAIPLPSLIFQTGYLTIDTYDEESRLYKLKFPNFEVKQSFQKLLLNVIAQVDPITGRELLQDLKSALVQSDMPEAIRILKQLFSRVPYQLHMPQEKFYHAILQIIFDLMGVRVQSEYSTSQGRIDVVLELPKLMYVVEVKFNQSAESALSQIEVKRYCEPFVSYNKPINLLGLSFQREPGKFDIIYVMKQLL